jgi:methyl-accepting chemotaxis protein
MEEDLGQLEENIQSVLASANHNTQTAAEIVQALDECRSRMNDAEVEYGVICEAFGEHADDCRLLVEQNKHFTTPSKQLGEVPAELRQQNQKYCETLEQMEDYGKQMGVVALNAAIEAGRMGDNGLSFVAAAEDVRTLAGKYSEAAGSLLEQIQDSNRRIEQLEDEIRRLVNLLKENNVSTTRVMKSSQDIVKLIQESSIGVFSEELSPMREELIGIRNAEEEAIKAEERNRMQLEDIQSEFAVQKERENEIKSALDPIFEKVEKYQES